MLLSDRPRNLGDVVDTKHVPIVVEVVAPDRYVERRGTSREITEEEIIAYVAALAKSLSFPHDAIAVADLWEDQPIDPKNPRHYVPPEKTKIDNLLFIRILRKAMQGSLPILYKVGVHSTQEALVSWVTDSHREGINTIMIVGGDRTGIDYPGLHPGEFARLIHALHPLSYVGSPMIQTRYAEFTRMAVKQKNGVQFVRSQLSFNAQPFIEVADAYLNHCESNGIQPMAIGAYFSPIVSRRAPGKDGDRTNITLIRNLIREGEHPERWKLFPRGVEAELRGSGNVTKKSAAFIIREMERILEYWERRRRAFPLLIGFEFLSRYPQQILQASEAMREIAEHLPKELRVEKELQSPQA